MLMSDQFYKSKGRMIKSPVDLMAGTVADFEIKAKKLLRGSGKYECYGSATHGSSQCQRMAWR